jgi:thiamine pyrophosphate-dependent acetolactate synthase large subunit-like protein
LCSQLRDLCPHDTIWAIQAATNASIVDDAIRPTLPSHFLSCAGGGLGWSGGGAMGIKLASEYEAQQTGGKGKFVVQIVGDGSYLHGNPSSVYWVAKRYDIPFLTIVLNNKGRSLFSISAVLSSPRRRQA